MNTQTIEWNTKPVDRLTFHSSPTLISSIEMRETTKVTPKTQSNQKIEFELNHETLIDLSTATLDAVITMTNDNTSANVYLANAIDIIEQISVFYNEVELEQIHNANVWSNVLTAYTGNDSWALTEANMVLGLVTPFGDDPVVVNSFAGSRAYSIPLSLVCGICRAPNFIPLFGNKLRFVINLAKVDQVISYYGAAKTNPKYELSDTVLTVDLVKVHEETRMKIWSAMQSDTGMRIPYTTLATSAHNIAGTGDTQNLRISHNHSNNLSLFILYNNRTAKDEFKAGDSDDNKKWINYNQSFPLPGFKEVTVRCGTRNFTPSEGLDTFAQLYTATEKCMNGVVNMIGTGWIGYNKYTGGYVRGDYKTGSYPICLMGFNLEKSLEEDFHVTGEGFASTSNGSSSWFDVRLKATGMTQGDEFLVAITHKRVLQFSSSGPRVIV